MHNLSTSENSAGDDFLEMSSHLAKVDRRIVFTETRSNISRKSNSSSSNVVVSASINIKNTSGDSERIMYKVKNTSTDSFKVFPIIGILGKGQTEKIKITVKPNFPKSLISYEHFQVQVLPIPPDYVPNLKGDGNKNTSNNANLQDSLDKSNISTTGTGTLHVNANNLETPCQSDTSSATSVESLKLIWLNILHKQVAIEKHYINCHYLNASIAIDHNKSKSTKKPDFEGSEPNKHKPTPEFDANNTQSTNNNSNSSKHKRKLSMTSDHRKNPESPRKTHDTNCYSKNIDDTGIRNRNFPQGVQKPVKGGGSRRQPPDDPRLNNNNNNTASFAAKIRPLGQDENGNDIIDFDKDLFSLSGNFLGRNTTTEPNPNDWNADDDDDDRKELFFHSMETYGWHRFAFVMAIVLFMLFLMAAGVIKEHEQPPPPPPTFTMQDDNPVEEDTFAPLEEGTTLEIIRSYAFRWLHDPRLSFKLF